MDGVADARAKMCASVRPLASEPAALDAALDRTLAQTLTAARDQPPFRSSAMDGYALRAADLDRERFAIVGQSAAGNPFLGAVGAAEAVRIFTGAPVPEGADLVVPQERTRREEAALVLDAGPRTSPNIRMVGVDFRAGVPLIPAGTRLNARHIALIAAAGVPSVEVSRMPRIAVLGTGSEVLPPGARAGPHQIYDSVTVGLGAMIERWGGCPLRRGICPDDEEAVAAAVLQALGGADLTVIAGGASVGDYDVVKRALAGHGLSVLVPQVAVRPGRPTWFATIGAKPILGLPGNPAAAFVCAHLFLRPLLDALLARDSVRDCAAAVLDGAVRESGAHESYWRAAVRTGSDARLVVRPFDNQDTSLVSIFAAANALIRRIAGAPAAAAGTIVEVTLLDCS